MIYFMQSVDGGPAKIGQSEDVSARHEQLERHYGTPLAILAIANGGRDEEAEIHAKFDHLRIKDERRRGPHIEQFRPAADLMAFIRRPLLAGPNPESVEAMPVKGAKREVVFVYKADSRIAPELKKWIDEFADHVGVPSLNLIDIALTAFAKEKGFRRMPKRQAR